MTGEGYKEETGQGEMLFLSSLLVIARERGFQKADVSWAAFWDETV